ncbi:MAG: hypothetical protein GDA38_07600 [Hormoscilla sp. SP12CHS1]|nr:hypothetical protein [Hormoscilla sp. SP12CHS1]
MGEESDESVLRAIAVRALKGSLREEIDRAVRFGGSEGFQVSYKDIKRLAETGHAGNANPDTTPKIARISPTMKNLLADELAEYRLPPHPEEGSLVVVTGIKNRETLEAAGVWRSLSSDERLPEDWEVIRHSRFMSSLMDIAKQESFKKICIAIGIGVFVLIVGLQFDKFLSKSNDLKTPTSPLDDIVTVKGENNDGDVVKITISEDLQKIQVVFTFGEKTSNSAYDALKIEKNLKEATKIASVKMVEEINKLNLNLGGK